MAQIKCRDLTLGYDGKIITQNLTFMINKGDYLCIVGENGTGKTTLIKALLNLKTPLGGTIKIGEELLANEVGYLPQQTAIQKDFPASVNEVVRSGFLNKTGLRPFYRKSEKKSADEIMERLMISKLGKKCYRELSGGQQQRVLLARALCSTSKMLILDEPVAGLDPKAAEGMYKVIKELNTIDQITIIMVSHDISEAIKYATHILHLGKEPKFFGTKQAYLCSEIGKKIC